MFTAEYLRSVRLFIIWLVCVHKLQVEAVEKKKPNIVVLIADDLGFDDLCLGDLGEEKDDCPYTEVLNHLAGEGVTLSNFYVQPLCSPTRAALLTGLYPIKTGMQTHVLQPTQPGGLHGKYKTIAEELKESDYMTSLVGKWHLGYSKWRHTPLFRGFDHFFGMYQGAADHYLHLPSLGNQSFRVPHLDWLLNGYDLRRQNEPAEIEESIHSTDKYVNEAIRVIEKHSQNEANPSPKPMFLIVSFQAIHDPIQAPDEWVHLNLHIKDHHRQQIAGMVSHLDHGIGRIIGSLKETRLWDNTVLIFFSDNGGNPKMGSSNFPFRGVKGTVFEGGVRSRAIVAGGFLPAKSKRTRCDGIVHVTDLFPTFAFLATNKEKVKKTNLDGFEFWSTLREGCGDDALKQHKRQGVLINIDPVGYPLQLDSSEMEYYYPSSYFRRRLAGRLGWSDKTKAYREGDMKLIIGRPGAGVTAIKPFEFNYYIDQQSLSIQEGFQGGKVGPKCEFVQNECMWLFNISADPGETTNLINVQRMQPVVQVLAEKIKQYQEEMVSPVNENGIFRHEGIQDHIDHLPLRFGGFLSPFEDLAGTESDIGIWLSYVAIALALFSLLSVFVLFIFVPLKLLRLV